jgi:hypothetical protein
MDNSDFYESSHAGMTDSMCLVIYIGNLAGGGQGLRRFEERRRREAMGSKGKGSHGQQREGAFYLQNAALHEDF